MLKPPIDKQISLISFICSSQICLGSTSFASTDYFFFDREREVITVERMAQYDVLKEKWHRELQIALESEENSSEELERYLNPSYCTNNNDDNGLVNDKNSIEVQQQLMFAKIEAQVYGMVGLCNYV